MSPDKSKLSHQELSMVRNAAGIGHTDGSERAIHAAVSALNDDKTFQELSPGRQGVVRQQTAKRTKAALKADSQSTASGHPKRSVYDKGRSATHLFVGSAARH